MTTRTLYLMVAALFCGVGSAALAFLFVSPNTVEVLVPIRDLAPHARLSDERMFEKRSLRQDELKRPSPVTDHGQIRDRYVRGLSLPKEQPIYLEDTTATSPQQTPTNTTSAPRRPQIDLPDRPLLSPGVIGITLPAGTTVPASVAKGDIYDLVLYRTDAEGIPDAEPPITIYSRALVLDVHRHRATAVVPPEAQVDALTFAIRVSEAAAVIEGLKQGQLVPLPSSSSPPNEQE